MTYIQDIIKIFFIFLFFLSARTYAESAATQDWPKTLANPPVNIPATIGFGYAGNKGMLYVISDPKCPHCQDFHKDMNFFISAGYTIEFMASPFRQENINNFASALCSKTPQKNLENLYADKAIPALTCPSRLNEQIQVPLGLKVTGTPFFIFRNIAFQGYPGKDVLLQILGGA